MKLLLQPKLLFLFTLLACCLNAYSQKFTDYLIQPEQSESHVLLREGRKDYGFGLNDSKGNLKWQLPVPGEPLGMGKSGNNVIVIYAEDHKIFRLIKVIHAMLVEPAKKKVLKDVVIYTNPGKMAIQPEILKDPAGNLSSVLVRQTTLKEGTGGFGGFGNAGSYEESKTLTMIHLGDDLVSQTKDLKSISLGSDYIVSYAGSNNEIYVCSYSNGQLVTERFNGSGNKMSQLATALSYRKKDHYNFVAEYDSLRENCFDLAFAYINEKKDRFIRLFRFDFNNKKTVITEPVIIDKDYLKTLKADNPESKLNHFTSIKFLRPLQVLNTPDQTFLIKEIQTANADSRGNVATYFRLGAVISVYSKDLKLIKDIPIDKISSNGLWGMNQIHGHVKGNKLYIVTNEKNGLGNQAVLYTINLDDLSMVSKNIPDPESGVNWLTTPDDVQWYNNNFLVPFERTKGSLKLKHNTEWASENY